MEKNKGLGAISWGKLVSACSITVFGLQTEDGWKAICGGSTKMLKFQKSEIESHKFCSCVLLVCYIRAYMLMLACVHPCGGQKQTLVIFLNCCPPSLSSMGPELIYLSVWHGSDL